MKIISKETECCQCKKEKTCFPMVHMDKHGSEIKGAEIYWMCSECGDYIFGSKQTVQAMDSFKEKK